MRRSLSAADHFGRWLLAQDFTLADADERKVEQYRGTLGRCASGAWPHRTNGLNLAMRFLMDKGVAHECTADGPLLPVEQWLRRFDDHLQRVVGSAPSTRQRYRPLLSRFLMSSHFGPLRRVLKQMVNFGDLFHRQRFGNIGGCLAESDVRGGGQTYHEFRSRRKRNFWICRQCNQGFGTPYRNANCRIYQ